jgi:hypothetical protein
MRPPTHQSIILITIFSLGPLQVEPKARKEARKASTRLDKNIKDLKKPQEVSPLDTERYAT